MPSGKVLNYILLKGSACSSGAALFHLSSASRRFALEKENSPAPAAIQVFCLSRPHALYHISLNVPERVVLPAGISGRNDDLDKSLRDHAGRLHANPVHLDHCRHRHRSHRPAADEFLPLRPDGRRVPGMAETDHHLLGHFKRFGIHYGLRDPLLPGRTVDSHLTYGYLRRYCRVDRRADHVRLGSDQHISFGRAGL